MAKKVSDSIVKCPTRPALDGHSKGEVTRKMRTTLCITRRGTRLLDADNYAGGCKPLIDQIRYAKLIPDDDPASVEILFRQVKVATKSEEGTEIEITGGSMRGESTELVNGNFD
jgi:hypothetical protein